MSLSQVLADQVPTPFGPIEVFRAPGGPSGGPLVICLAEPGVAVEPFLALQSAVMRLAEVRVMRLPSEGAGPAVATVIAGGFASRPIVLFAAGVGALAAFSVRAPNLRRIVTVAPTLGFEAEEALQALAIPADVLLGRDAAPVDSARFAAHPRVRLHRANAPGGALLAEGSPIVRDVLQEAVRRASATPAVDVAEFDELLFEATPVTARRLAHWGPGGRAFAAAALARNPAAEVVLAEPDADLPPGADFDAVVLGAPPTMTALERLAARLRPCGSLVARWIPRAAATPALDAAMAGYGLRLLDHVDEAGSAVLRAQKRPDSAPPALVLQYDAFAPFLMDIRTRLPARALRSLPELRVGYYPRNAQLAPLEADRPKVAVLQRPAQSSLDAWRAYMARAVAGGWLVVQEIDDHPQLIAEAMREPFSERNLAPLGWMHAVQTSTELLADVFRPYNPVVKVLPNALFDLRPFPARDRGPRVLYGAVGRGAFAVDVARALGPAVAARPDMVFEVVADRAVFEALPTDRKRFHDYLSYEAYLELMESCSISLSPAPARPLLATKSDAKFLDAARAGALTVGSPLIYGTTIEHGVNGLLAETPEAFAGLLARAAQDVDWRRGMARRAWEAVRARRIFCDQAPVWRDWYLELWSRRDELNAALVQRLPGLAEAIAALAR